MLLLEVALFHFVASVLSVAQSDVDCKKKLQEVAIIPTYGDTRTSADVKVLYGTKDEVKCGNEFSPLPPSTSPKVTYDAQGRCENMTILMFNPDMPFWKKVVVLHWLVVNVPSDVMKDGYATGADGDESADYWPPVFMTGNQRNTICVYCQANYIQPSTTLRNPFARFGIDPKDLAEKNNLGNPEACNFFYVSFGTGLEIYFPFNIIAEWNKKMFNKDM